MCIFTRRRVSLYYTTSSSFFFFARCSNMTSHSAAIPLRTRITIPMVAQNTVTLLYFFFFTPYIFEFHHYHALSRFTTYEQTQFAHTWHHVIHMLHILNDNEILLFVTLMVGGFNATAQTILHQSLLLFRHTSALVRNTRISPTVYIFALLQLFFNYIRTQCL